MKDRNVSTVNLRNYYTVDSILLNEHAKFHFKNNDDFNDYVSIKAAMLSTLFEFYQHIGYVPVEKLKFENSKQLAESAVVYAKKSKALAANMIQKPAFIQEIKNQVREGVRQNKVSDVKGFSRKVVTERFNRMCLDNVLIGIPMLEAKHPEKAKDFKGKILEEAYMTMRNSLIRHAKTAERVSEDFRSGARTGQTKAS